MKKIYFTLILILALAFALVLVSSATYIDTLSVDSLSQNSSLVFANYGSLYYCFSGEGYVVYEFDIFEYSNDKPYYKSYIISDIDNFQDEFQGVNYSEFVNILQSTYYYYGVAEYQYNYLMSWSPPISQEQYNQLQQGYNTLQGEYNQLQTNYSNLEQNFQNLSNSYNTLQGEFNSLQNDYTRLGALLDDTVNQYYTLQGEYNTLQGEYNTLESTIPVVRQEGYSQGLEDADALSDGLGVILSAPVYFLNNVFNFEILGFSMRSIFATIITVLTIAWVTKKLSY